LLQHLYNPILVLKVNIQVLMVIRAYHESRNDSHRNICLIPASAHGTNPASAVMAGMKVVVTGTDEKGNIDWDDLHEKAL